MKPGQLVVSVRINSMDVMMARFIENFIHAANKGLDFFCSFLGHGFPHIFLSIFEFNLESYSLIIVGKIEFRLQYFGRKPRSFL